jgi:hypothetical protein
VFDRVLVLAGRRYVFAAAQAARHGAAYVRIDDWMRPAVADGVRLATITALTIAVVGIIAVVVAVRLDERRK